MDEKQPALNRVEERKYERTPRAKWLDLLEEILEGQFGG
jgi:hypothetical protein